MMVRRIILNGWDSADLVYRLAVCLNKRSRYLVKVFLKGWDADFDHAVIQLLKLVVLWISVQFI